jgi:hypothetical protein
MAKKAPHQAVILMHIHSQPLTSTGEMTGINSYQSNPSFSIVGKNEKEVMEKIDKIMEFMKELCKTKTLE